MQIKISNLSYTYLAKTPNEVEALHNVSLDIPEGKITSIIGHTGSGKSTLIQTLNGLLLPTSGEVRVGEYVVTNKKKKRIPQKRKPKIKGKTTHNAKNRPMHDSYTLNGIFIVASADVFQESLE